MKQIEKNYLINYQSQEVKIILKTNIFDELIYYLDLNKTYYIITDSNVSKLYLETLLKQLPNSYSYSITPLEDSKSLDTAKLIISDMLDHQISKNDEIIALGGGVVGDLAGFIASIYKRGIQYINIPTTLLSQVDSSIGGKTGVNFNRNHLVYKNQIGSIYHPKLIFIDSSLLSTLPKKEYVSGLGEVIKYAICFDKSMFSSLFENFSIDEIIDRCIQIKTNITKVDENEKKERIALNFGHTIGHAIESYTDFKISHGLAVLYGMLYEINDPILKAELLKLCKALGIDLELDFPIDLLKEYIMQDKKRSHNLILVPILKEIGNVKIESMDFETYFRRLL